MITLNVIIDIVAIMPKYEQAELTYQEQVKSDFSEALEKENLEWLDGLIDGLVESHKKTPRPKQAKRKFGIESLEIFNIQNSKGRTAVMIAAKHGMADLLEKWYEVPGDFTNDKYIPEEKQKIYEQRIFSYIAQDNEGKNALMLAVRSGNSACFPFLLSPETAMTLNQKDKDGKTALIHAIESGNPNLVQEFLSVTEEILDNVNQYDLNSEIKLEIDVNTSKCIQNIKDENIKSLVDNFLTECEEFIFHMPTPKRKNTEQTDKVAQKKRKPNFTATVEKIQSLIEAVEKRENNIRPAKLIEIKKFVDDKKKKLAESDTDLMQDYVDQVNQKLEKLEDKLQEIGQLLLEKLLNEAKISNLIDEKKEEILKHIEDLIIKARIEFPEDLIQNIPSNIIYEVTDIITTGEKNKQLPNSQLYSPINELASCSRNSPLQR